MYDPGDEEGGEGMCISGSFPTMLAAPSARQCHTEVLEFIRGFCSISFVLRN